MAGEEIKTRWKCPGVVTACVLVVALTQIGVSYYLYRYIVQVDERCSQHIRHKRQAASLEENAVSSSGYDSVEFYSPAVEEVRGTPGPDGEKSWVWLTAHSRIPVTAIQGFCKATKDYCPAAPQGPTGVPGVPGSRGIPGMKGDRGDRGLPGEAGLRGPPGIPGEHGPRGPKGEPGWPGSPGLDGRDGIPGEPGLDGMPGRNGLDGIPGLDGSPGLNGIPGIPGRNGTDGRSGLPGPQGPPGLKGVRGLSGPRGRAGKPGNNGTPGIPGITTWRTKVNGTDELLIPPSIAGMGSHHKPIVVHERENVRLRCTATGTPRPVVEWRKVDGSVIPMGSWQMVSVSGPVLNITQISRRHMGTYICLADNGVPSSANQTFHLDVHFPPLIRILNQMVGAYNGSTATLECHIEAFPEARRYWERADGRPLSNTDKYHTRDIKEGRYKVHMQLNISNIRSSDFGLYHCIAKNDMGITKGVFTLFEIDPRLATPAPIQLGGHGEAIYGQPPPPPVDLDDLCPPPVLCPECPRLKEMQCQEGSMSFYQLLGQLEVKPLKIGNIKFTGLPPRVLGCQLYAVGKPVYHRSTNADYGCWMQDPVPPTPAQEEKLWVTYENDTRMLYEYYNKTAYKKDAPSRRFRLIHPFQGNSQVVYNGSFYYNDKDKPCLWKYDLHYLNSTSLDIPVAVTSGRNYLYTTEQNYMDLSVDDNGLWVIFGLPNNYTGVMKVDTNTMKIQYMWNITMNHHVFGEMFVVCGVLYAVDSVTERNTKIRFALDLYKSTLLNVNLPFTNPFKKTTMVGYNPKNKELYTWDKGNQLTYPIRYHEADHTIGRSDSVYST